MKLNLDTNANADAVRRCIRFVQVTGTLSLACFIVAAVDRATGVISYAPTFWHFLAYLSLPVIGVWLLRNRSSVPRLPPFRFVGPSPRYRRYANYTRKAKQP